MSALLAAVIAVVVAAAYGFLGTAKVLATADMRRRAAHVDVSVEGYRRIGVLEVAGAAGVLAGLAWTPIGFAAGIGLVLLMAGALVAHLRVKAPLREVVAPVAFGAVVIGYLVILAVR